MIELLVVLVILGLLAGLVGPQLFGQVDSSKVKTADTQVKMLKVALQTYKLDVGKFPEELRYLDENPGTSVKNWNGPYLEEKLPLDPWGNSYQYALAKSARHGFNLYSFGADGKAGGEGIDADVGYVPNKDL